VRFNINHNVRVRLTDFGHQIVWKRHAELSEFLKSVGGPPLSGDGATTEDNEGWSEWQLWKLMETFGPHIRMGADVPFETEIEIPQAIDAVDPQADSTGKPTTREEKP
jgi:hypothetical protein